MGKFETDIQDASTKYNVPPEIIKAIIQVESSWNENAYRYEAKIKDASYGLMQILYSTAEGLGYVGKPNGLYDPPTNIDLGTHYLSDQFKKYGHWLDAFAAYNAGRIGKHPDGKYINQQYVDKVRSALFKIIKNQQGFATSINKTLTDLIQ